MTNESSMQRTTILLGLALIVAVIMFLLAVNQPKQPALILPQGQVDEGHQEVLEAEAVHENGHAVEKHSGDALAVRECFKNYGSLHIYFNPNTQRYLEVCFMDDGKYGVRITERIKEKLEEITAFKKDKFTTWEQMRQYIENGGYTNQVK